MASLADAFLAQAASDLDAYENLTRSTLPSCHRLHYLQMWLEKLSKAYVLFQSGSEQLEHTHNIVAAVLPTLVREHWRRVGLRARPEASAIRLLCRKVDLLHPQVNDGGRHRMNVEYPWLGSAGGYEIPARSSFELTRALYERDGRDLQKAAVSLTRNPVR